MTVDPTQLRHTIDATMDAEQINPYFGEKEARQFVSDSSGRVLVTPKGGEANRVPVYGAAKPTSSTTAALNGNAIELSGTGIDQGEGSDAYQSLASVFELGTTSPEQSEATLPTEKAADIQYVGASSDKDLLTFGVATYGDWANVGNIVIPYVDYDVTGDGKNDYETYLQNIEGTDLLFAWTVDLAKGTLIDLEPVNLLLGDTDSNVFDSNVVTMSVYKGALGLPATGSAPITYTAGTSAVYGGDETDPVSYDAGTPVIGTANPLYLDEGDTSIELTGTRAEDAKALVLHLHGKKGARAEVIDVPAAPATATTP
jgi:hypothetical protein